MSLIIAAYTPASISICAHEAVAQLLRIRRYYLTAEMQVLKPAGPKRDSEEWRIWSYFGESSRLVLFPW